MKTYKPLFLFLACFFCCGTTYAEEDLNLAPNFVIEMCQIEYMGKKLPVPGSIESWTKVLGAYDRKVRLANDVYVWDDLGVQVYSRWGAKKVLSLNFLFNLSWLSITEKHLEWANSEAEKKSYQVAIDGRPKTLFNRAFMLDGVLINEDVDIPKINEKLTSYFKDHYDLLPDQESKTFQKSYMPIIFEYTRVCGQGLEITSQIRVLKKYPKRMRVFTIGIKENDDGTRK